MQYTYDNGANGIGRLSSVELPFGRIDYIYDARGLITSEERSFTLDGIAGATVSKRVRREYNALEQVTRSEWDDGQQWQVTYDRRGLVDTVQWLDPQTGVLREVANFDRSLLGLPRNRTSEFGQTREHLYDILGRPLEDRVTLEGRSEPLASRRYAYTGAGDLSSVTGATAGVSADASYSYDAQHRLESANGPNGYAGSFTYSPTGNLLTAKITWNGSPETRDVRYEYDAVDPQAVSHLVNADGGAAFASFQYDLAGNMVQRNAPQGATALHWDGLDRLRMAQAPGETEVYFYDHTGARMLSVSQAQGVHFWFAESETHYDLEGTPAKNYLHLAAGGPTLARVEDGTKVELQYADALQNLMFSLDATGEITASFFYGAFGEVLQATGAADHRRQFNGKESDAATGLRYYGYRYYDPLILRWNNADPLYTAIPDLGLAVPQRMNLYAFSLNNPLRYYDPDGREGTDADAEGETSGDLTCELDELGTCEEDDSADEEETSNASDETSCDSTNASCSGVNEQTSNSDVKEQTSKDVVAQSSHGAGGSALLVRFASWVKRKAQAAASAYANARGGDFVMEDGRLERRTRTEIIERQTQDRHPRRRMHLTRRVTAADPVDYKVG